MTSPSCEQMRRQLLDNYLRNQQQQAQVPSQTHTPIHHQTIAQNQHVFHPSQFATMQQSYANTTNTGYDGDRSDTFSEVSRMSNIVVKQQINKFKMCNHQVIEILRT